MIIGESIRLAVESLRHHKLRTFLTILGMTIGVFAVVALVSLGQGAKNYVMSEFENLGTNIILIQPGKSDKKSNFGPPIGSAATKMTLADVKALQKKTYTLEAVTGVVLGTASIRYQESVSNAQVLGTNDQFPKIIKIRIDSGSYYSSEEDDYGRRVVVLGAKLYQQLFGRESALGKSVKLNSSEFRVIGTLLDAGDTLGLNIDEFAFIPTQSALRLFNEDKLFGIRAKANAKVTIDLAVEEITNILKERRDGEEDFTVITQLTMMDSMNNLLDMLSYVLGGIAAISMLVGGIGIMNIMLVSVTERTQEIGIRRAVGARKRDIMSQFISEAVMLSVLSGLIGILLASSLAFVFRIFYPSFNMQAPYWIYLPAFLLSVIVGVVFGAWPARKASNIQILDALRHE
ncbi:ABC transporter permease [bacterium]|nr:ABC transporter permease [bacterium]